MKESGPLYISKVLAVDDDKTNLKIVRAQLDEAGYRYRLVDKPTDVMDAVRDMRPDVILLDRMMPRKGLQELMRDGEETGDTLCRLIRSDPALRAVRIIMVTAKAREADELEGLQVGADDYITKPYSEEILLERLRKQLDSRRREEFEDFTKQVLSFFGHHLLNGIDIMRGPTALVGEVLDALVPGLQELGRLVAEAEAGGRALDPAAVRPLLERSVIDPDGSLGRTSLGLLMEGVTAQRDLASQGLLYVDLLMATRPAIDYINLRRLADRVIVQWEEAMQASAEAAQPSVRSSPSAAFRDIRYELGGDDTESPFLIRGVEAWLERALLNLLDNAFRFSEDGDTITFSLRQRGSEFLFKIADTGFGIAPDRLYRIFEPFSIEESAIRHGQPRLNLPIARKVVELHNGELRVESTPGEGSTFTVTLPIV